MLRVSMPEGFANIFLSPLIADFARRHPGISFEFDLSARSVDLVTEPFDVAIRMGEPPISNLIARPIASLRRYLYASPRYLEHAGVPTKPADLAQHECLRTRTTEADVWALHPVSGKGTTVEVRIGGRFALNSVVMLQRFATLDLGIAVLAEDVVAQDVDASRLCRVLPDWRATPVSVHAVTETRLLPAKTQRFIDFLREKLARRE
jgi:DNA-binding transcriptional LysR family regulator